MYTSKIAAILLVAGIVAFVGRLMILPPVSEDVTRYGTGTFPLALAAGSFLCAAILFDIARYIPGDDLEARAERDFFQGIGSVFVCSGTAFTGIFIYALLAGLPMVPA